jgi:hypothetical protein
MTELLEDMIKCDQLVNTYRLIYASVNCKVCKIYSCMQ